MTPQSYNPEVGLPVTGDSEWEHDDVMNRAWTAGEVHDALSNAGFVAHAFDDTMTAPDADGVERPLTLHRSKRWVHPDGRALRVPTDASQIVSPYLGACVSALLVDAD